MTRMLCVDLQLANSLPLCSLAMHDLAQPYLAVVSILRDTLILLRTLNSFSDC